ncbi:MAG: hypothetical protein GX033_01965 [Firmicutes bacterium]|nr:hypothetical protein [Bacillota bacterium]
MNQIDLLAIIFILFGGWLGSLRSLARNFIGFASTTIGLALASLYGSSLVDFWTRLLQPLSISSHWLPQWAAMASTNSVNWQQAAYIWLEQLPWPENFKGWIVTSWGQLAANSDFMEWGRVVEQAFWRSLTNVCSFLTVMLLVKLVVTLIARFSLRLAFYDKFTVSWPGFLVGALQSAILVFLVAAIAVPFLLLSERTTPMLSPSFTFTLVRRMLEHFIVT